MNKSNVTKTLLSIYLSFVPAVRMCICGHSGHLRIPCAPSLSFSCVYLGILILPVRVLHHV